MKSQQVNAFPARRKKDELPADRDKCALPVHTSSPRHLQLGLIGLVNSGDNDTEWLFTEKLKRFEWAVEIPREAINLVLLWNKSSLPTSEIYLKPKKAAGPCVPHLPSPTIPLFSIVSTVPLSPGSSFSSSLSLGRFFFFMKSYSIHPRPTTIFCLHSKNPRCWRLTLCLWNTSPCSPPHLIHSIMGGGGGVLHSHYQSLLMNHPPPTLSGCLTLTHRRRKPDFQLCVRCMAHVWGFSIFLGEGCGKSHSGSRSVRKIWFRLFLCEAEIHLINSSLQKSLPLAKIYQNQIILSASKMWELGLFF